MVRKTTSINVRSNVKIWRLNVGTYSDTRLETKFLENSKTNLLRAFSLILCSTQIPRSTYWISILISNKQIVNLSQDIITDIAT